MLKNIRSSSYSRSLTDVSNVSFRGSSIFTYVLGYMILYMPTLALVNSVAFKQMKDPEKNFQILEFGNYWMDISRTIYQLYFSLGLSEGVTQGLLKTLFFYQELPH
jgi:hypothetical protein